jgi:hypothetical protein
MKHTQMFERMGYNDKVKSWLSSCVDFQRYVLQNVFFCEAIDLVASPA